MLSVLLLLGAADGEALLALSGTQCFFVSNWVPLCVCLCVCVYTEPTMDGSGGVYPVHPVLGESRHVQLRPLSVGAAHWRNSLRSLKTW